MKQVHLQVRLLLEYCKTADRAVIVGSQSFGKGLVQSVIAIDNSSALKITNSKYYIPSGRGIQKEVY